MGLKIALMLMAVGLLQIITAAVVHYLTWRGLQQRWALRLANAPKIVHDHELVYLLRRDEYAHWLQTSIKDLESRP